MTSYYPIHRFQYKNVTRDDYAAMNRHANILRSERLPDDPPIPLKESIMELQSIPPYVNLLMWGAWNTTGHEMIGLGYVQLMRMEENRHLAQFDITVQPKYRQHGLGRRLLALITDAAHADSRHFLITETTDRVPAGESFVKRLGGERGLETHVNQLRIADLDLCLLAEWLEKGRSRSLDFELGLWDCPYPEAHLQAVVQLLELTNQQPYGGIENDDKHVTPQQLRQAEQHLYNRGDQRWTFYLIEKLTNNFVGYTETVWNPNCPEILRQEMTGVVPRYRNMGLGRWLKAAMLDKVLRERPQVKFVRSCNADLNAVMLKINKKLGFRLYSASALWQIEIDRVLAYLGRER
jgi:mycothiol synthase